MGSSRLRSDPPPLEECGQVGRPDGTTSYQVAKLTPRESTMTIPSEFTGPVSGYIAFEIFKRYPWNPPDRDVCTDIFKLTKQPGCWNRTSTDVRSPSASQCFKSEKGWSINLPACVVGGKLTWLGRRLYHTYRIPDEIWVRFFYPSMEEADQLISSLTKADLQGP